jgi:nucleotide-binding universal stress UspA family protein
MQLDRILVFTPHEDRDARAIQLASELARRSGAELTLLRVLEEGLRWNPQRRATDRGQEIRDLLVDVETGELEKLAKPLEDAGLSVEVRVSWGVPWEEISGLAESGRFDLVVKPARGLNRKGRVFFGSTALHLFRKCPCPVWVVGDDGRPPEKILAAIDPADDPARRSVAEQILRVADRIGSWLGAAVHVGSAWHAPGAKALSGRIERAELKEYLQDAHTRSQELLDAVLEASQASIEPERVHLVEGPARDVLPRFAEENEFDLIVIGTLGRTGIVGQLLGETAEMILREVRCSVLTISPDRSESASRDS